MEIKPVRDQAREIQNRFFEALERLMELKHISNLSSFCSEYNLHRPKYSNLRTLSKDKSKPGTGYKFIDLDALSYLVKDYNISAEWLLLGKGDMFKKGTGITNVYS